MGKPSSSGTRAAPTQLHPAVNSFLEQTLHDFSFAFTVSDPTQEDNPIVYVSSGFSTLTGYSEEEVLGKNCRFLQGPDTDRRKVLEIRDAIREGRACHVCLLNYKKDGTKFVNMFYLSPIRNDHGQLIHYVGIQSDVTEEVRRNGRLGAARLDLDFEAGSAGSVSEGESDDMAGPILAQEEEEARRLAQALAHEPCSSSTPSGLPCSLLQPLLDVHESFTLADATRPDMPIVYASDHFLALTGYSRDEVLNRNCRFLQGPDTDPASVARLKAALASSPPEPCSVTLLNYRRDGTSFWNYLHVAPVRDADGRVVFFCGVQLDVTGAKAADGSAAGEARRSGLKDTVAHKSATGAVKVAVRSLGSSETGGLRRDSGSQGLPSRGTSRSNSREQQAL